MASKGENTRERILDVAQSIVLQKGFSGTSIDEIIEESGITKGGFFYHFRGKSDLAVHLMQRYLDHEDALTEQLLSRADSLSEDPLQRMLIYLKLYAEVLGEMQSLHPGCLVASYTYESQLFDPEIREMMVRGLNDWEQAMRVRFGEIIGKYPPRLDVGAEDLSLNLLSIVEGGIILARNLATPNLIAGQILQFRSYVRLLFGDA